MLNRPLLKIALIPLLLFALDVVVIMYNVARCSITGSAFYCDSFMFAGIFIVFGIPALVLLSVALIISISSKFYKGFVARWFRAILIVLSLLIFVISYIPLLASVIKQGDEPVTYRGWLQQREQFRLELQKKQEQECLQYKLKMSQWKVGSPTSPTPPSPDCN